MSAPDDTFSAALTRRDALGVVTLDGNVAGTRRYVGDTLGVVHAEPSLHWSLRHAGRGHGAWQTNDQRKPVRGSVYVEAPNFRAPARLAVETEYDLRADLRAVLRDARALVAEHKHEATR